MTTTIGPEQVAQDVFAVHSRLLDHRAVVRAECKYVVKEMELKRNDREHTRLKSMLSKAEKSNLILDECAEVARERIDVVHALVVDAASTGYDILNRDSNEEALRDMYRIKREEEWKIFQGEMSKAKDDVLKTHERSLADLRKQPEENSDS